MNQNNDYNFDPMTGQPIQHQTQQTLNSQQEQSNNQQKMNISYIEQPVQNPTKKKKNKSFVIIIIIVIIGILVGTTLFNNKQDSTNNESNNNVDAGNNNEQNNNIQNNNSIGKVEEGTNTSYDENGAFLFSIEDIFTMDSRGATATGKVERGKVKVGDSVQIIGINKEIITTKVVSIKTFRDTLEEASIGDNVGIILKDITRDQLERGQVLAQPNSIIASTKFDADIHMFTKEENGRHTPFFSNYRPQFYFRTADVTGTITLPEGTEMVMPGETTSLTVELILPIAMEVGTEFTIREGGRTVGKGTVTKVYK